MIMDTLLNTMLAWYSPYFSYVSAHTDYPSTTGAHEVTGGDPAYARKFATFNTIAGGMAIADPGVSLDVPAGTTVAWIGFWDDGSAGNWAGCAPQGGSPKRYLVDTLSSLILCTAHGYNDGDKVVIWGQGTMPGGVTAGQIYYVVNKATDDFQIAETLGGDPIDLTSAPVGSTWVSKIVPVDYASQGTHVVNTAAISLVA